MKTCFWTGNGHKELECEISELSESKITVLTTENIPILGSEGIIWRPFLPIFPAKVISHDAHGFTAEFIEVGAQNAFRDEANQALASLASAYNKPQNTPNPKRPRMLGRILLKLLFCIEQSLPNIDRRTFSANEFPWSLEFEKKWRAIRSEIESVFSKVDISDIPLGPDKLKNWSSIVVAEKGKSTDEAKQLLPLTARLVDSVPSLIFAGFSIFEPGAELDYHKANSRVFLRMHLGLVVPQGDVRLQIEDQELSWEEGKVLIFDDFYPHLAWNRTDQRRVVLIVDFLRPMPFWKKLIINLLNRGGGSLQNIPKAWLDL